jgi:hypothetical protein
MAYDRTKHNTDINNVGSISQALFAKGDPEFDEKKASQWQATQVSTVSIANCIGRVMIGWSYIVVGDTHLSGKF